MVLMPSWDIPMLWKYHSQESLWAENLHFKANFSLFFFVRMELFRTFDASNGYYGIMVHALTLLSTLLRKPLFAASEALGCALRGG